MTSSPGPAGPPRVGGDRIAAALQIVLDLRDAGAVVVEPLALNPCTRDGEGNARPPPATHRCPCWS
jgi:hypothetical protein